MKEQQASPATWQAKTKGYILIEGDEVNSLHSVIMRELNAEQLTALRDKLMRRTPRINPQDLNRIYF